MPEHSLASLRLLWITENYYPSQGGMAQACDRIVCGLRERGVTVDLVHFSKRFRKKAGIQQQQGGRYIPWKMGEDISHELNCCWNFLSQDHCKYKYTHIVAFGGFLPLLSGPVYAAWMKIPLVTLLRGNDFDSAIFDSKRIPVLREALLRSQKVCAVSRDKVEKISALYPQIHPLWVPNGIDLEKWNPLPSDITWAEKWRKEILQDRRSLGFFGHFKLKKGLVFFLENLIRSGYKDLFHLLIVGEMDEETKTWFASHESQIHCQAFPFVEWYKMIPYYLACDLVAIPSFYEGFPNVLLEAGALKIPFLASLAGGMADALGDGEKGFLFFPGDGGACQKAISLAARALEADLKRMGEKCRTMVENHFTLSMEMEAYIKIFLELL